MGKENEARKRKVGTLSNDLSELGKTAKGEGEA
jgi:hypothetical protein